MLRVYHSLKAKKDCGWEWDYFEYKFHSSQYECFKIIRELCRYAKNKNLIIFRVNCGFEARDIDGEVIELFGVSMGDN